MTRRDADLASTLIVLALTLVLATLAGLWWAHLAQAQPAVEPPREQSEPDGPVELAVHHAAEGPLAGGLDRTLAVALARVCVAEAGWRMPSTGECAAIYAVIESRARRRRVRRLRALRDYASGHFDAARSRRPWIAGLREDGRRPEHWPEHARWSEYRALWLAAIEHAVDVLAGRVVSPCVEAPDHWGQAHGGDLARALRAGWRRVQCDVAVNAFWRMR